MHCFDRHFALLCLVIEGDYRLLLSDEFFSCVFVLFFSILYILNAYSNTQLRGLSIHRSNTGVAGTYGVGTVTSVGSGVLGVSPASQVFVASSGTWTSEAVLNTQEVFPISDSSDTSSDAPLDASQAACLPEAASAWALLHTFVSLSPGDVVVRSAEPSPLNSALDQVAAAGGFVMVPASASDLVDAKFKDKVASKGPVRLAVTSGTGKSARAMHALTGSKGVLVTYNGAIAPLSDSHDSIELPSLSMIFQDQEVCGFDFRSWAANNPAEASRALSESAALMRKGQLKFTPVAFKAAQFKEAVECASSGKAAVIEL